jgi:hypothetical protein
MLTHVLGHIPRLSDLTTQRLLAMPRAIHNIGGGRCSRIRYEKTQASDGDDRDDSN